MAHVFSPLANRTTSVGRAISSVLLGALLALGGCATVPPPDNAMNQAQTQLLAARDAGAADYAPVDLGFAQDKFQQAQAAMAERKYPVAGALAEEAAADAELARAKARLGAARAQIESKMQENTRLREQGEQAAAAGQSSSPTALPNAAPVEDMPAPASSVLSSPPPTDGFETVPDATQQQPNQQPSSTPQGGQP